MKHLRRFLAIFLIVSVAFVAGRLSPSLRRPPLVLGQDAAVTGVAADRVAVSYDPDGGGFIDVAPRGGYRTLFNLSSTFPRKPVSPKLKVGKNPLRRYRNESTRVVC